MNKREGEREREFRWCLESARVGSQQKAIKAVLLDQESPCSRPRRVPAAIGQWGEGGGGAEY